MDFTRILALFLLLVPLTWVLGIDQFMLYLVVPLIVARALAGPMMVSPGDRGLRLALLTLLAAISLSAISLLGAPSFRWLTYARDYLAIASFIGVLMLQRPLAPGESVTVLVVAIVWFMFVANLAGFLAWATGFNTPFLSPAGYLVPGFILENELGQNSFVKRLLLKSSTYLFGHEFNRVRSFFIYPNTYALAVGVSLPLTIYLLIRSALLNRWIVSAIYLIVLLLSATGMFLTFSRSGVVALAGGFLIFTYLSVHRRLGPYARTLLRLMGVAAIVAFVYFAYVEWNELIYDIAVARGASNLEHRTLVFFESFRQLLGNPIGFGTQRDAPGILLPLGSHSQFVAVAYKYGFAGLAAWLLFLVILGKRVMTGLRLANGQGDVEAVAFYSTMGWAILTNIAHQITAEQMLDTVTFTVLLSLWLALLARPLPGVVPAAAPVPELRPAPA